MSLDRNCTDPLLPIMVQWILGHHFWLTHGCYREDTRPCRGECHVVKSNLYFANPQLQVAPVYCTSWLEKPSAHHPKPPKQEDHQITNPKTTPILGKSHLSKLLKCYRTFTWFDHPLKYGQFHQHKRKSRPSLPTATHHSCYTNATSACGQGLGDVPAQRESALWNVLLYRVSGGCVSFFCGQPFLFKFADGVQLCRHTILNLLISHTFLGGLKSSFRPKILSIGNCTSHL